MKIILISGKSGSGKSEAAKIMKELLKEKGIRSCITGFSKYLKIFAEEVLDWNGSEEEKPRKFLQDLGMMVREVRKDYLINRMIEDVYVYEKMVDVVIISDVRMKEEIEVFKDKFKALSIRVNRNENNKLNERERMHITENDLNDYENYDYIIDNNNDDLKEKVKIIVEECF